MLACPLKGDTTTYFRQCDGENCSWWLPKDKCCCVLAIAKASEIMITPPEPIVMTTGFTDISHGTIIMDDVLSRLQNKADEIINPKR